MEIVSTKKAVTYTRVSSLVQEREGYSIPAQKKLLKEYALSNSIRIVKEFSEAETAKKAGRTEFKKMVEFLKSNPDIKIILVEKTDRLYRNLSDYSVLSVEDFNVEIHLVKENEILTNDSRSHQKFIHGIKVLMAKNYSDNLSEEVKKGHNEKLESGIWPSKAPLGYLNKLENHSIIVDSTISPLIKRTFEEAKSGSYSFAKLSQKMFDIGLVSARSKKKLSKSAISRLLSNSFYYGDFTWKGKTYRGTHEPLISKLLFSEVQLKMGLACKPRNNCMDFVFRGPLTCGHCESQITAETKKKTSGKKYTYYHCTNGKGICKNVTYLREEKIEEQYIEALRSIKLTDDILKFTKVALIESHHQEKEFRENQLKIHLARYKKLESYIDQAYTDKLEGILDTDTWKYRTSSWKVEQEGLNAKISVLREANTTYMLEGIKLIELANNAHLLFPLMNTDEKRELISLVLSNPRVEYGTIRYDYKKPFDMFVNVTQIESWRSIPLLIRKIVSSNISD